MIDSDEDGISNEYHCMVSPDGEKYCIARIDDLDEAPEKEVEGYPVLILHWVMAGAYVGEYDVPEGFVMIGMML